MASDDIPSDDIRRSTHEGGLDDDLRALLTDDAGGLLDDEVVGAADPFTDDTPLAPRTSDDAAAARDALDARLDADADDAPSDETAAVDTPSTDKVTDDAAANASDAADEAPDTADAEANPLPDAAEVEDAAPAEESAAPPAGESPDHVPAEDAPAPDAPPQAAAAAEDDRPAELRDEPLPPHAADESSAAEGARKTDGPGGIAGDDESFEFPPREERDNAAPAEDKPLSDDMAEALIAAAEGRVPKRDDSRPLPVPELVEQGLLSQDDLDKLIQEARGQQPKTTPEEESAKTARAPAVERPRGRKRAWLRRRALRLTAAGLAGALAGSGAFAMLAAQQTQVPELERVLVHTTDDLRVAMEKAAPRLASGDYAGAVAELEEPVARSIPSPLRADARFMLLEAYTHGRDSIVGGPDRVALQALLDELFDDHGDHPRAPEALRWKATLYEEQALPLAALETYRRILQQYPDIDWVDTALINAAELAIEVGEAPEAVAYTRRLQQEFPQSPHAARALMVYAEANAEAGNFSDARTILVRVAEAQPHSALGARAYLRLAELAMQQGRYDEAILHLETRLRMATTSEGNDQVYLLLGKAYRERRQYEEARAALNDVINFYPRSSVIPEAYVTLSEVLDAQGQRDEALRVAQDAGMQFPDNPIVLRHQGEMLGLTGNPYAAAHAFLAADASGARDPGVLLSAARYLRTAGFPEEALDAYERLQRRYASTYPALTGAIEEARLRFERGNVSEAVAQLEALNTAAEGSPRRAAILEALLDAYSTLGLEERVATLAGNLAGATDKPESLAVAAEALYRVGNDTAAREIGTRIDLEALAPTRAHALLTSMADAAIARSPDEALALLETARARHPDGFTPAQQKQLLRLYLGTDRRAAARGLVMELAAAAEAEPVQSVHVVDAATLWGDHLFEQGDYRGALEAYELAAESGTALEGERGEVDPRWPLYQQANALLALSQFRDGLAILEEQAAGDAAWAAEAAEKAEYARLQLRLRGDTTQTAQAEDADAPTAN